jgi:poly(3-hydroxybutyrate) depolymerase
MMPVIVLHGDQDQVIPYRCGEQALRQWLGTDQLVAERQDGSAPPVGPATVRAGVVAGGHTYTVASYPDRQGCTLAQLWTIHGMGHAWSGGSDDPSVALYTDPRGPSAAAASSSFFLQWKLSRGRSVCSRE